MLENSRANVLKGKKLKTKKTKRGKTKDKTCTEEKKLL